MEWERDKLNYSGKKHNLAVSKLTAKLINLNLAVNFGSTSSAYFDRLF